MFLEHYPRTMTKRETIGTNLSRSRARKLDNFKFLALAVNASCMVYTVHICMQYLVNDILYTLFSIGCIIRMYTIRL
jgi:hypothetical protein